MTAPEAQILSRQAATHLTVPRGHVASDRSRLSARASHPATLESTVRTTGVEGNARTLLQPAPSVDLRALAGTWSQEEAQEFDRRLAEIRRVDPELWR